MNLSLLGGVYVIYNGKHSAPFTELNKNKHGVEKTMRCIPSINTCYKHPAVNPTILMWWGNSKFEAMKLLNLRHPSAIHTSCPPHGGLCLK